MPGGAAYGAPPGSELPVEHDPFSDPVPVGNYMAPPPYCGQHHVGSNGYPLILMQGFPAAMAIYAAAVEFLGAHSLRIAAPKYTKIRSAGGVSVPGFR